MCENERNRDLEKTNDAAYKAAIKSEFYGKIDDLFNQAINKYIDEGHEWFMEMGICLGYVRDFIKENI